MLSQTNTSVETKMLECDAVNKDQQCPAILSSAFSALCPHANLRPTNVQLCIAPLSSTFSVFSPLVQSHPHLHPRDVSSVRSNGKQCFLRSFPSPQLRSSLHRRSAVHGDAKQCFSPCFLRSFPNVIPIRSLAWRP